MSWLPGWDAQRYFSESELRLDLRIAAPRTLRILPFGLRGSRPRQLMHNADLYGILSCALFQPIISYGAIGNPPLQESEYYMTSPHKYHCLINTAIIFLLAMLLPIVAAAQNWNESFDSGDMIATADVTIGAGPLTSIMGAHIAQFDPTDMYCVSIPDLSAFQAYLVCTTLDDRDLWLFDANGYGIGMDDGCAFSVTRVSGQFGSTSGLYYLAVTADVNEALSSTGSIWDPPIVSGERAPDGPGAANPLTVWVNAVNVLTSPYTVYLSGAEFCEAAVARETLPWGSMKSIYR